MQSIIGPLLCICLLVSEREEKYEVVVNQKEFSVGGKVG